MAWKLFSDGFERHGLTGQTTPAISTLLLRYWTSIVSPASLVHSLVASLSAAGQALQIGTSTGSVASGSLILNKTLPSSLGRYVVGFRVSSNLPGVPSQWNVGITLQDTAANPQISVSVNKSGNIEVRVGGNTSQLPTTVVATSSVALVANAAHCITVDLTIHNTAGAYQVWLDGVSIIGPTTNVNTRGGTSNNSANSVGIFAAFATATTNQTVIGVVDDLIVGDPTQSDYDSSFLTSNPRCLWLQPNADAQAQFTQSQTAILGSANSTTASTNAPGANELFGRIFTPATDMTLYGVSLMPGATSAAAKFKAVLYPVSGGKIDAQAPIATGAEVIGCASGTPLASAFGSTQSLVGGTSYGLCFITDTSVVLNETDATTTGFKAANTYTSGAPNPAPTTTGAQNSWSVWGTGTYSSNYAAVNQDPAPASPGYFSSNTVGREDLYAFPAIGTFDKVFAVDVCVLALKPSGSRLLSMQMSSSGTDSVAGGSQAPASGINYTWLYGTFTADPATAGALTPTIVNAANYGMKIAA